MKQYLVAIRDGGLFYRVADIEELDDLYASYGPLITHVWEMGSVNTDLPELFLVSPN